jgi:hypothetical protein
MIRRPAAATLAAATLPTAAAAHSFAPGPDPWSQIISGALVPLSDPALLLALLPLGLTLGIWSTEGLPRLWPVLAAGLVTGAAAGPLAGLSIAFTAILTGLATALMGAAALAWPFWLMAAVAAATGLVTGMTMLEGHPFGSLPTTLYLGMIGGALLTVAIPFVLTATTRTVIPAPWLTIGRRVASSWLAAIALMLAALRFA